MKTARELLAETAATMAAMDIAMAEYRRSMDRIESIERAAASLRFEMQLNASLALQAAKKLEEN